MKPKSSFKAFAAALFAVPKHEAIMDEKPETKAKVEPLEPKAKPAPRLASP